MITYTVETLYATSLQGWRSQIRWVIARTSYNPIWYQFSITIAYQKTRVHIRLPIAHNTNNQE
ncbi:hypothetical protein ACE1CI_31275 [Aerosakkonemataceae cyanobacterium BLCC-F50]|uniref:Uncharacterized protein n=1 Tax=Floridaenema flaviceps BLCC-F50 TaxID=3153642 RepID=A0ABV4Y2B2_9CYAN